MLKSKHHLVMLIDQSESMTSFRQAVVDGHNTMLREQQTIDADMDYSLLCFNRQMYGPATNGQPIASAKPISLADLRPNGPTALLDALGHTIQQGLAANHKNVTLVTVTDGLENASRTFTFERVAMMIKECEEHHGWNFIFLAADMNTVRQASHLGIGRKRSFTMGGKGRAWVEGVRMVSGKLAHMRRDGDRSHLDFTDEERSQFNKRNDDLTD